MKNKTLLFLLVAFVFASTLTYSNDSIGESPNVIIVLTDDQGYGELSCHGNPILKTPALDVLNKQSVRLNDFHVTPMCTPTRGQLMTGLDAARNGAVNVSSGRELLNPELTTMADVFSNNGYSTGIFGKWHLGDNYPYRPQDRGFNETLWFPSSHIGSVPDFWGNDYFDDVYFHNGKRKKYNGYCTDVFFQEAMKFIKASVSDNKPFFVYLPTNTPHWPLNAKEVDSVFIAEVISTLSDFNINSKIKAKLVSYLAMIKNIDDNMAKLFVFLETQELAENTIVIFMTDNGTIMGQHYYNAGMRGMKCELWEGGHRVPCFIKWPNGGLIQPQGIDGLTQVQDILPTLIDLCDLEYSSSIEFDGISLAKVLKGEKQVPEDRIFAINYSRMPGGFDYPSPYGQSIVKRDGSVVLWKRWRLLENRYLYNLNDDPLQQNNVIQQYPEVVNKMRNYLNRWWAEVNTTANDPQRIVIGHESENPMVLTACDWLDVFVDQQGQVRRGTKKNGFWLLHVEQDGNYEFELFRWPKELNRAINYNETGIDDAKIAFAKLYISGVEHLSIENKKPYSFEGLKQKVEADQKSVKFEVNLKTGPVALHTWFEDKNRESLFGSYYVIVHRK